MITSLITKYYICEYLDVTHQKFFDEGNTHPEAFQAMSKVNRELPGFLNCSEKRSIICFAGMNMDYIAKLSIATCQRAGSILFPK